VLPLAQNHESGIECNSCEPGSKLRSAVETLQVNEGPHKRVLKRILSVLMIAGNLPDGAKQAWRMEPAISTPAERPRISSTERPLPIVIS
jgi:hypothetical protein